MGITEIRRSGGQYDFEVDDKARKRQESQDTDSTHEFKEAYRNHMKKPKWKRKLRAFFKR